MVGQHAKLRVVDMQCEWMMHFRQQCVLYQARYDWATVSAFRGARMALQIASNEHLRHSMAAVCCVDISS